MIDRDVLAQLEPGVQAAVESAILTIANSGVMDMQLRVAFESIVAGALDESETSIAARISKYRLENYGLIALRELADQLKKDSR